MNNVTEVHPDLVYEAILATVSHPTKRRNLGLINEVCRERNQAGSKDFSLKAVGDVVCSRGGPKTKVLWNAQSSDYRKLIEVWQAYAGGPKCTEIAKGGAPEALMQGILDPAARIIVERLVSERNSLRAEVNILKSHTKLVIDKRPKFAPGEQTIESPGAVAVEITTCPALNLLEREAFEHAVSEELWRSEGWIEEKNGRIVKDLGDGRTRTIFKPGFVIAIRKILRN